MENLTHRLGHAVTGWLQALVSFCRRCFDADASQSEPYADRSRLISENGILAENEHGFFNAGIRGSITTDEDRRYCHSASLSHAEPLDQMHLRSKPLNDDQMLLNDILTQMANDIIDVCIAGTAAPNALEPTDFQERAHDYGRRLVVVARELAAKHTILLTGQGDAEQPSGLVDSRSDADRLLSQCVLGGHDAVLIDEVTERVRESGGPEMFRIRHTSQVLAGFGSSESQACDTDAS